MESPAQLTSIICQPSQSFYLQKRQITREGGSIDNNNIERDIFLFLGHVWDCESKGKAVSAYNGGNEQLALSDVVR